MMGRDISDAIIEFTTDLGTRIILDGASNGANDYEDWLEAHWTLFLNEADYLTP